MIAPLRCIRIPPGPGVRTIAKVPLRRGDVDVEFDQELLAELLDQLPFNMAIADLYKTRFNGVPGVVYAAGVRHAMNVAEAFRELDIKAMGVSGETPKRELAEILAQYERGEIDVLVNAQLLAEGWNSPRATICMHLAPTASKRIYQQRVGRVTRRHPGKESGIVVDFVHPATKHDDPVVTLHSLLDRDVYRGGAIVVGPVRRGRGRRLRVERRVIPVTADEERRHEVFERELWRIAVEHLDWGEQHMWAALAGARVAPSGWRRARAMLHFDKTGELKRRFLVTAVERNKNSQLRVRALQEIAALRDDEAFRTAVDVVGTWSRDERREGAKVLLQALAERRIGRRDEASQWIWDIADMTRDVHEEYAVQRWPETKRLLGLLVNSSGGAHARNARRLVHAARKQDRRLSAAILAAAVAHTPEAMEVVRGARTRMARKPSALSRELLRNFPKGRKGRNRRRRRKGDPQEAAVERGGGPQTTTPETGRTTTGARTSVRGARGQEARPPPHAQQACGGEGRRAGVRRAQVARAARCRGEPSSRRPAPRARTREARAASPAAARARSPSPSDRRRLTHGARPVHSDISRRVERTAQVDLAASSAVRPPPGSSTTRRPSPSIPAAVPAPPDHEIRRPRSASRARHASRSSRVGSASARSSASSSVARNGSTSAGARPSVAAVSCSSGGRSSTRTATLTPMPSTAQSSCGRPSARIPRELAALEQDVVGPLDPRVAPRRPRRARPRRRAAAAAARRAARATSAARRPAAPTRSVPGARARPIAPPRSRACRVARRPPPARARGRSSSSSRAGAAAGGPASRLDQDLVVQLPDRGTRAPSRGSPPGRASCRHPRRASARRARPPRTSARRSPACRSPVRSRRAAGPRSSPGRA